MIMLSLFMATLFPAPTQAADLKFVKYDVDAANGKCLPPLEESANAVLARNSIGVTDAASPEVNKALAKVISTIARIGKGKFQSQQGVTYLFGKEPGYSYHQSGTTEIHLNPGGQNLHSLKDKRFGGTNNTATLAHELGHYIAFRDNFRVKQMYENYVQSPCTFTWYSTVQKNGYRNEEFAEVFAAFVSNPSLLQNKGDACDQARVFFSYLFEEAQGKSESCQSRLDSLDQ